MFNCGYFINRYISNNNMGSNKVRSSNIKIVRKMISNYFRPKIAKPPYDHICQIGDPVLRTKTKPINIKLIRDHEFQEVLEKLSNVMRKYNLSGISASQIGLPWQVFALEQTEESLNKLDKEFRDFYSMDPFPLTYFINPEMKIIDPTKVAHYETCQSITGFSATVLRAKEVQIKAFNQFGEPFTWFAKGWQAKLAQHEYSHLQGKLFTDEMDPSTFHCIIWEEVNKHHGKVQLRFYR
ncbi:peptide deformylase, mitochondrial [Ptiloglossa arizonensis]|uniref:peptide deformylase, mitochondrial n=1 Tax=Ptiloglossa arizonensis TaxID=3350558 RepID=UPI003F9EF7DD